MKNYSLEIEKAIKEYEEFKPYKTHKLEWISARIDWCYKFRHITEDEMHDFCDRMVNIFSNGVCYG